VPQEARLGCRLQEPPGGLAGAFAKRRLTKRSREHLLYEVRCIGAYPGRLVMAEALDGGERGTGGAHADYDGLYVAIKVKNVSTP
jgi:hypothetical protein